MRHRIDNLEDLVKRLIAERQQVSSPGKNLVYTPESPQPESALTTSSAVVSDAQVVAGVGETVIDGMHSVYLGGDDWYNVLQEVVHYLSSPSLTLIQPGPYPFINSLSVVFSYFALSLLATQGLAYLSITSTNLK